jgi:hypothetical protein
MELMFSDRAPITLPKEKQRDLNAALADLLLNAAAVKFSDPIPEDQREVESASKVDD